MWVTEPNVVNYIDTLEIIRDIQRATELGSDLKIMTIHWGTEYELLQIKHSIILHNSLLIMVLG